MRKLEEHESARDRVHTVASEWRALARGMKQKKMVALERLRRVCIEHGKFSITDDDSKSADRARQFSSQKHPSRSGLTDRKPYWLTDVQKTGDNKF